MKRAPRERGFEHLGKGLWPCARGCSPGSPYSTSACVGEQGGCPHPSPEGAGGQSEQSTGCADPHKFLCVFLAVPMPDPRAPMQRGPLPASGPPPRGLLGDAPNDPRGGTLLSVTGEVEPR